MAAKLERLRCGSGSGASKELLHAVEQAKASVMRGESCCWSGHIEPVRTVRISCHQPFGAFYVHAGRPSSTQLAKSKCAFLLIIQLMSRE